MTSHQSETLGSYKQRLDGMSNFMLRSLLEGLGIGPGRTRRAMIQQLLNVQRQTTATSHAEKVVGAHDEKAGGGDNDVPAGAKIANERAPSASSSSSSSTDRYIGTSGRAESETTRSGQEPQDAITIEGTKGKDHVRLNTGERLEHSARRNKFQQQRPVNRAEFFLRYCDPLCPVGQVVLVQELRFHRLDEMVHRLFIPESYLTSGPEGGPAAEGDDTAESANGTGSSDATFFHIRCCKKTKSPGREDLLQLAWPRNDLRVSVCCGGSEVEYKIDPSRTRNPLAIVAETAENTLDIMGKVPSDDAGQGEQRDRRTGKRNHGAAASSVDVIDLESFSLARSCEPGLVAADEIVARKARSTNGKGRQRAITLNLSLGRPFLEDEATYHIMVCRGRRLTCKNFVGLITANAASKSCVENDRGSSSCVSPVATLTSKKRRRCGSSGSRGGQTSQKSGDGSKRARRSSVDSVVLVADVENDAASGDQRCPLSLSEMAVPAWGSKCQHKFDLQSLAELIASAKTNAAVARKCPVCAVPLLYGTDATFFQTPALYESFNWLRTGEPQASE